MKSIKINLNTFHISLRMILRGYDANPSSLGVSIGRVAVYIPEDATLNPFSLSLQCLININAFHILCSERLDIYVRSLTCT